MDNLQKGLDFLLDKYSVEKKAVLKDLFTISLDGKDVPILSHRGERRFTELKNIALGGTLCGISVMRVSRIVEKGSDLNLELKREFDICGFVLGEKITSVTTFKNDNTMNVIAKTESGIVCTLEISATLKKGEKAIDKHEIIARRGTACDVVVDAQLKQDSIYLLGETNSKYTDVDFELYGLTPEEIAVVRSAFSITQKDLADEYIAIEKELNKLICTSDKSADTMERVVL